MFSEEESKYYLKRAALYVRVSTEEQARKGYSIEAQREELENYAKKFHMQIIGEYCDDGASARKEMRKRKHLMRLLEDVKQDKIDYILFIKLDRWFRSIKDYYKIQEILDDHNVGWKATLENYDTTTTNGRLSLNIRLSVAQDESDRTSDRIKFVNESRVLHGGVLTGSLPYALKIEGGRVVPDQEKSEVVDAIFTCYESYQSRAKCMHLVRDQYGLMMGYATIVRMLSNTLYKGEYKGNTNYCEAIITPERFDRVQALMPNNHYRNVSKHPYIFSRIVKCGKCGNAMVGHPQHDYKYGKVYLRYRCNKCWREKQCDNKTAIWEKRIEEYLIKNVRSQLQAHLAAYEAELSQKKAPSSDAPKLKARLKKLKALYLDDLIDLDEYRKDYQELKGRLEEVEQEQPHPKPDLGLLYAFLDSPFEEVYETMQPDEKRALWSSIISCISITDRKHISVTFL